MVVCVAHLESGRDDDLAEIILNAERITNLGADGRWLQITHSAGSQRDISHSFSILAPCSSCRHKTRPHVIVIVQAIPQNFPNISSLITRVCRCRNSGSFHRITSFSHDTFSQRSWNPLVVARVAWNVREKWNIGHYSKIFHEISRDWNIFYFLGTRVHDKN